MGTISILAGLVGQGVMGLSGKRFGEGFGKTGPESSRCSVRSRQGRERDARLVVVDFQYLCSPHRLSASCGSSGGGRKSLTRTGQHLDPSVWFCLYPTLPALRFGSAAAAFFLMPFSFAPTRPTEGLLDLRVPSLRSRSGCPFPSFSRRATSAAASFLPPAALLLLLLVLVLGLAFASFGLRALRPLAAVPVLLTVEILALRVLRRFGGGGSEPRAFAAPRVRGLLPTSSFSSDADPAEETALRLPFRTDADPAVARGKVSKGSSNQQRLLKY